MMVQENGAQRPAPVRDMSAHAAAAPPDLNLKTRCKNIFKILDYSQKKIAGNMFLGLEQRLGYIFVYFQIMDPTAPPPPNGTASPVTAAPSPTSSTIPRPSWLLALLLHKEEITRLVRFHTLLHCFLFQSGFLVSPRLRFDPKIKSVKIIKFSP
ncbi:hypothetical protein FCV25MIE_21944 [Fagus crenata]